MKLRNKLPAAPAPRSMTIVVSRTMFLGFIAVILGPWLAWFGILAWQSCKGDNQSIAEVSSHRNSWSGPRRYYTTSRDRTSEEELDTKHADRISWCRPGPWGDIKLTRISIEMPSEFIFLSEEMPPPVRWYVPGATRESMMQALKQAGLTPEQLSMVSADDVWEVNSEGIWLTPPDEVVLGLSPAARAKLYNSLSLFPENESQRTAFTYRPELIDERIEDSGLRPETIDLFRKLLYPRGKSMLFADSIPMLRWLGDDIDEQRRLVKTVSRKATLLAKVRISPNTDIEELVRYWGVGGRAKDLRPLLESIQRVDGGGYLDIIHLLPAFARRRLHTFPLSTENSMELQPDCHWTAMNFFNDPPDDRFADINYASNVVRSEYSVIAEPGHLGDLVFITDPSGGAIHSAVYIADDLVFTKNGARFTEPWTIMRLDEMLDLYLAGQPADAPLKVVYFRHHKL